MSDDKINDAHKRFAMSVINTAIKDFALLRKGKSIGKEESIVTMRSFFFRSKRFEYFCALAGLDVDAVRDSLHYNMGEGMNVYLTMFQVEEALQMKSSEVLSLVYNKELNYIKGTGIGDCRRMKFRASDVDAIADRLYKAGELV